MVKENVYWTKETPEMIEAFKKAQETFRYFWRELYWESRRIVPALDFAFIKVAFHQKKLFYKEGITEFMWVRVLDFDGHTITGVVDNKPQSINNIKLGAEIAIPLEEVCDWLFSNVRKAYGGFTIHVLRKEMGQEEREAHDQAWQIDFGDSNNILLVYEQFEKPENLIEHPMSVVMKESFITYLEQHQDELTSKNDKGYTMLHTEAVAGNLPMIEVLLEKGVDRYATTEYGDTALDLAKKMNWEHLIKVLEG